MVIIPLYETLAAASAGLCCARLMYGTICSCCSARGWSDDNRIYIGRMDIAERRQLLRLFFWVTSTSLLSAASSSTIIWLYRKRNEFLEKKNNGLNSSPPRAVPCRAKICNYRALSALGFTLAPSIFITAPFTVSFLFFFLFLMLRRSTCAGLQFFGGVWATSSRVRSVVVYSFSFHCCVVISLKKGQGNLSNVHVEKRNLMHLPNLRSTLRHDSSLGAYGTLHCPFFVY